MAGLGLSSLFGGDSGGGGIMDSISGLFSSIPSSIASAGIFSAASLVSQLFGRNIQGEQMDLARNRFQQDILEATANRKVQEDQIAASQANAAAAAGATVKAAGISAGAQKDIAHKRNLLEIGESRSSALDRSADRRIKSMQGRSELIMQGRTAQADAARATGQGGAQALEALMQGVESGLRR